MGHGKRLARTLGGGVVLILFKVKRGRKDGFTDRPNGGGGGGYQLKKTHKIGRPAGLKRTPNDREKNRKKGP